VVSLFVAFRLFDSLLAIPLGIVAGESLYCPIKMAAAASTIGSDWGKCWGEMMKLDATKVSAGGGEGAFAAFILYPLGMISLIIATKIIHSEFMMWLAFIVAVTSGSGFVFGSIPAAVLFLGRSSESDEFLAALRRSLQPLRVTSLLKPDSLKSRFIIWQRAFDFDNVRVKKDRDWFEVVERLATITPILVIDGRRESFDLVTELKLLNQPEIAVKTFVIVDSDGNAAAIDAAIARGALSIHNQIWKRLSPSETLIELPRLCSNPNSLASLKKQGRAALKRAQKKD